MDANKLRCACFNSWSDDTCFLGCRDEWNNENRYLGQCAITALILQDCLGGKIKKCEVENSDITHYYNEVDGKELDFTIEQFQNGEKLIKERYKTRDEMLASKHTKQRYELLKQRVNKFLKEMNDTDLEIKDCNKCTGLVEKFDHSTTVHYGKDTKIVIVGEAPANNGWRKSGRCWYGADGKITGSGKVMHKLLDAMYLKLEDITFIEAVKCYPTDRKHLADCKKNCYEYLLRQLEILKPQVVLTLGDMATKSLMTSLKYNNFKEVVGVVHKIVIVENEINVIPIYHPSPISPLGYKGNEPIFESVRKYI
ncbi:MAG TPA: hypothetical protein DEP72_01530 [Clostridiales bacterium]|nr:hypothetical protein [Clostridiales bacterium]